MAESISLGRRIVRAFLALWWILIVALFVWILQYIVSSAAPVVIPLLPGVITWVRALPLAAQVAMSLFGIAALALMGWLTYLAWRHQQRQVAAKGAANSAQHAEAIRGVVESNVKPQLGVLDAKLEKLTQGEPLPFVRQLTRDLFKLGDPFAENIAYYREPPISGAFDAAVQALQNAANLPAKDKRPASQLSADARRGVVIMGEANSGKSRLMFEALTATLPDWSALLWSEARSTAEIPRADVLRDRDVVIILDDLQNYVSIGEDHISRAANQSSVSVTSLLATGPDAVLSELLRSAQKDARRVVIVATCRSEHERPTAAKLGWLLTQLVEITMPHFNPDKNDPSAAAILRFFRANGASQPEAEWDGTIGSGVLGLKKKRSEYQSLVVHGYAAATVLRAMKLLSLSGIPRHSEARVRQVCGEVFGKPQLLDDEQIWRNAYEELLDLEFVRLVKERRTAGANHPEMVLVIRKDTYFDYIVYDYPSPGERIPGQLDDDRSKLFQALIHLGDAPGLDSLGRTFGNAGLLQEALAAFQQSVNFDSQNANAWVGLGGAFMLLNQPKEALEPFQQAHVLDPQNALALTVLGGTLHILGRREEGLAAVEDALAITSNLSATWWVRGMILSDLHQSVEALSAYDQSLALDPEEVIAWIGKGTVLLTLKRYDEALEAFERTTVLDPRNASAWKGKGNALANLRRHDEALMAYDQAIALDPKDADDWNNKGNALLDLSRYDEALAAYNQAIALDAKAALVWRNKADLLNHTGQFTEGLVAAEQSLELEPQNIRGWELKARVLDGMKRYDEALVAYDKTIELDPNIPLNWNGRAYSLAAMKRYDEALASVEQAIALAPDNADYHDSKGEILAMAGRLKESISFFQRAVELDATFINSWKNLVAIYNDLGRTTEAEEAERHVHELAAERPR